VTSELGAKRLGLLREVVPAAAVIAVMLTPSNPGAPQVSKEIEQAAHSIRILLRASSDAEVEGAFAVLAQRQAGALVMMPDPFFNTRRDQIIGLAARDGVPTIYDSREYVAAGGLMSYGTNYPDIYIVRSASMLGELSEASSRLICRSCSRRNSS